MLLMEGGQFVQRGLARAALTIDRLLADLRSQGVYYVHDMVSLHVDRKGRLRVVRPSVTVNEGTAEAAIPLETRIPLIVDGRVLRAGLRAAGIPPSHLREQLRARGIRRLAHVALAQFRPLEAELYVDAYTDRGDPLTADPASKTTRS